jgi:hypothetical protein
MAPLLPPPLTPLTPLERCCLALLAPFGAALLATVARRPSMFTRRHGRTHRLLGAAHLLLLALGVADVALWQADAVRAAARLAYDVALSACAVALALSAAAAFDHCSVVNRASGALDADATVTHAEMVEHAFYQGLNLVQILYLHALPRVRAAAGAPGCLAACLVATTPWLARSRFPVHSFSANYAQAPWSRTALMYRLKKYQYVLYKHALLHGLNISAALAAAAAVPENGAAVSLAQTRAFRLFWVCLNAAYVLEFFLQTLVKRRVLAQGRMLALNALLMAASTAAALPVLRRVRPLAAAASLALNFARRGRELSNTALVAALVAAAAASG